MNEDRPRAEVYMPIAEIYIHAYCTSTIGRHDNGYDIPYKYKYVFKQSIKKLYVLFICRTQK
jgi:hypothetical protein